MLGRYAPGIRRADGPGQVTGDVGKKYTFMSRKPKTPSEPVKKPAGKKPSSPNRAQETEAIFSKSAKRKIAYVDIEMGGTLKIVKSFTPEEIEYEQAGDYKTDFEPTDQVFYELEESIKQCLEDNLGIQVEFELDNGYFETIDIEYATKQKTSRTK